MASPFALRSADLGFAWFDARHGSDAARYSPPELGGLKIALALRQLCDLPCGVVAIAAIASDKRLGLLLDELVVSTAAREPAEDRHVQSL